MTYPTWLKRSLLLGLYLLIAAWTHIQAAVIYVDLTATAGAQNGSSWTDAYLNLTNGLAAASAGDTIWVADGIYYPGASGANSATFTLKVNVAVYGGFQGLSGAQETALSQRDFLNNLTVLSGDLDTSASFTAADAFHVVTAQGGGQDTTAVLDGFTVSGGNASGTGINTRAGAIFATGGGGRFENCIIEKNQASDNNHKQ